MTLIKIVQLNEAISKMEDKIDASFYLDGVKEYRDKSLNKKDWYELLDNYVKSRWWVFVNRN